MFFERVASSCCASGCVGDGFVFFEAGPLSCGVVHFEDSVHQHGGAAGAVCFGQNLCVLAQFDLDDVPLLRTRVLYKKQDDASRLYQAKTSVYWVYAKFIFISFPSRFHLLLISSYVYGAKDFALNWICIFSFSLSYNTSTFSFRQLEKLLAYLWILP